MTIGQLDCLATDSAKVLCVRMMVGGLPSLIIYRDGQEVGQYRGEGELDTIREWLENKRGDRVVEKENMKVSLEEMTVKVEL